MSKTPRYVRVTATGDVGIVIDEYVQPASQWNGPHDIPMLIVDNRNWVRPLHLRPGQYTEVPNYTVNPNQPITRTKKVIQVDGSPAIVQRDDAAYWRQIALEAQNEIAILRNRILELQTQLENRPLHDQHPPEQNSRLTNL